MLYYASVRDYRHHGTSESGAGAAADSRHVRPGIYPNILAGRELIGEAAI